MKKYRLLFSMLLGCNLLSGCKAAYRGPNVGTWLFAIPGLLLVVLACFRIRSIRMYNRDHPKRPLPREHQQLSAVVLLAGLILLVLAFISTYL